MKIGDFTKEEAAMAGQCIEQMFEAIPEDRQWRYLGRLNAALGFVEAAERVAPQEKEE